MNNIISLTLFSILLFILAISYVLGVSFFLTDYMWSVSLILYLILVYSLRYANGINSIDFYSLFYISILVFIFGRFFGVILGYDKNPIFQLDFFVYRSLNDFEKTKLMYYSYAGLISLEIGLYISRLIFNREKEFCYKINLSKRSLYIILFIYILYTVISLFFQVQNTIKYGYLDQLAQSQSSDYTFQSGTIITLTSAFLISLFCLQDNKRITNIFLLFLGLNTISVLVMGTRGAFICYLLFLIWYYNDFGFKKVNIAKVIIYFSLIFLFLNTIFYYITFRENDENALNIYQRMGKFIYDQGVTLMVFNESTYYNDYPIHQYFQNFIPGSTFIYNTFYHSIPFYDKTFVTHLNYYSNPGLFQLGYGLGWAFFSDIYIYSSGILAFYILYIVLFSIFINWLQFNLKRSLLVGIMTIGTFMYIIYLPRSYLATAFPLLVYIFVIYYSYRLVFKRKK
ncbi:O-antigen polymerase [Acinetobacter nectaris]|uniref:O-antigen polymerase n=1 Tax=Acinetobacter nectaris TaxID=1219382 RepID=UPI001F1D4294|nr:O-antigen polymerase [Acinetobacter nectaris]MCF9027063.1 O-antigen polysaccharide polymerase Wzy [Acinetobacter nectaris]